MKAKTKNVLHDEKYLREWLDSLSDKINGDVLPKMRGSAFVFAIVVEGEIDPYLLMQIGAAVLLEKPLILFALGGVWIPKRARELADEVIEGESFKDPAVQERARAAVERVVERLRREGRTV